LRCHFTVVLNDGSLSNYGFGWFLTPEKNQLTIQEVIGYRNFIMRDLGQKKTLIYGLRMLEMPSLKIR
jgi:hypothetical protein